ncbi:Uncharacterized protein dnm_011070 [Desulfonema magnum]|uniref:Uncharacterized protein n=1 Tax=Desulfonema magnum TaxID=45655 RepID=A0A975BGZ0_9BACT|nr:Uncharacterized protein dnm_011070 [Desulfonema magnum]
MERSGTHHMLISGYAWWVPLRSIHPTLLIIFAGRSLQPRPKYFQANN